MPDNLYEQTRNDVNEGRRRSDLPDHVHEQIGKGEPTAAVQAGKVLVEFQGLEKDIDDLLRRTCDLEAALEERLSPVLNPYTTASDSPAKVTGTDPAHQESSPLAERLVYLQHRSRTIQATLSRCFNILERVEV